MGGEAGAGGCFLQQPINLDVLDLVAPSAFLAQEQRAVMGVTEVLAGRIGVAALDLVDEAVLKKKIEGAIDGRRRDRLAFAARKLVDDRIGPKWGRAFGQDGQNLSAERGQMQTLPATGALHLPLPAGSSRLVFRGRISLWRCLFPHRVVHHITANVSV